MAVTYNVTHATPGVPIEATGAPQGRQYHWETEIDGAWVVQPDTDFEEYTIPADMRATRVRFCWSDKSPQPIVTYRRVAGPGEWQAGDIVEADLTNAPGVTAYQWQYVRSRNEPASNATWLNSSAAGATTYRLTIPTNLLPPGGGQLQYWYRVTWTRYGDTETAPNFIGVRP